MPKNTDGNGHNLNKGIFCLDIRKFFKVGVDKDRSFPEIPSIGPNLVKQYSKDWIWGYIDLIDGVIF